MENQEQLTNSAGVFPTESIPENMPTPNISTEDITTGKYQPISTLGYIGIMLLFGIPFVGPIIAIVWACGGCRKVNKRNFARASLVMGVLLLIISVLAGVAVHKLTDMFLEQIAQKVAPVTELQLDGLDSLEGLENMEDVDALMQMLEGLSGAVSDGDLSMYDDLGIYEDLSIYEDLGIYEDIGMYEDMLNSLFNDITFETKEEPAEQQGGN